ncbi:MAG: hypothetical protein K8I03_09975 [Ignavibacteria bacterium]|nr:hypothetical protein [Ignavibacteria bacterium]
MKTTLSLLILTAFLVISSTNTRSQDNYNLTTEITQFADSLDLILGLSTNLPGEYLCNSVTTYRNIRAIGMQETKISYYFMQKDDSVIETSGSIEFLQQYSPASKVNIAYNIAASQKVNISYYYLGNLIYCKHLSSGDYGYEEKRICLRGDELIKIERYDTNDEKPAYRKVRDFSRHDLFEASEVRRNSEEYEKLGKSLFKAEQLFK